MSPTMTEADIRAALAAFNLGDRVEGVHARDGLAQVSLRASREEAAGLEPLRREIEARLRTLPGVTAATVVLTAPAQAAPAAAEAPLLPGVKHVLAVASGKGGVGKSTVSVNLAVALAGLGLKTGLLDADIYGPSLPTMLGIAERPVITGNRIQTLDAFGVKSMSMGYLVPETRALIWRGPMVMGALTQMLGQVEWGELDIMVVDLPPGTGDAQLTLVQKARPAGAVIVSTPQDLALADARRAIQMFGQAGVRLVGLIENMSWFCCPACGHRTEIFGHGGARAEAEKLGVPFLGEIPLDMAVRAAGDAGRPVAALPESGPVAAGFHAVAAEVARALGLA